MWIIVAFLIIGIPISTLVYSETKVPYTTIVYKKPITDLKPPIIKITYPEPPSTFPYKLKLFIMSQCTQNNVPYLLVFKLIEKESQWNLHARNYNVDSHGKVWSIDYNLMQINSTNISKFKEKYHAQARTPESYDAINNPYDNTELGIKHLSDLYNTLHDWGKVVAAYNAGLTRVLNNGIKDVTKEYADYIVPYPEWWNQPEGVLIVKD